MDKIIKWTKLSRTAIAERLEEQGFKVSVTVVDGLLKKHNFGRRQAFKVEVGKKNIPQRDEQFKNLWYNVVKPDSRVALHGCMMNF